MSDSPKPKRTDVTDDLLLDDSKAPRRALVFDAEGRLVSAPDDMPEYLAKIRKAPTGA